MPKTSPAREEIVAFLKSGEAGQTSDIEINALKRAAQNLFTAQGLDCPVSIINANGTTVLINREKVESNGTSTDTTIA